MAAIGVDLGSRNTGIFLLANGDFLINRCDIVRRGQEETYPAYAQRIANTIRVQVEAHAGRHCIAVDIPLFPPDAPLVRRPIEEMFQQGQFSTHPNHAGIQPNNPEGLTETIELGRLLLTYLQNDCNATWAPNPTAVPEDRNVVIEVYPTLALGLIANYDRLVNDRRWLSLFGKPFALMRCLKAAQDGLTLPHLFPEGALALVCHESLIANGWNKDHVAALMSAVLGHSFLEECPKIYWCEMGHYVLPPEVIWHTGWNVPAMANGVHQVH